MPKIAELKDYYFRWEWVEVGEPETILEKFYQDRHFLFDSDSCGSVDTNWAVGDEGSFKFFSVHHDWWWENYGQENSNLVNEIGIKEITEDMARKTVKKWAVV